MADGLWVRETTTKGRLVSSWILALPRADMEHCIKIGKFGLPTRQIITAVKDGDDVACYATKEAVIIGIGTVRKGYYVGKTQVFLKPGTFDHRFDFECRKLDPELNFRILIPKLKLTGGSANWGPVLRPGIARVTAEDWELLQTAIADLS